jgi:hypothetical protein
MNDHPSEQHTSKFSGQHFILPPFISINDVTPTGASEVEFVLTNEATGKFYKVNRATVQFLESLKKTGSVHKALSDAQIPTTLQDGLIAPLVQAGVLVTPGETHLAPAPKAPIEGKLISMRADLLDIQPLTHALDWLGRILYSPLGYLAWAIAVITTVFQLLINADKVRIGLRSIPDMGWSSFVVFGLIYLGVKFVHELGHALAYSIYCQRSGFEPGPIRSGIAIFAMTPFPFTDVTGAWRLKSKWQRAMIGAGGLYFETWAIAILTLFWAQTQTGPIQMIILQVAIVAGLLAMFFNLNPAVKLDGYYILTDILGRPNLASRASQAARNLVVRLLGGQGKVERFDLGYWIVSYLYRWTIFAGIFWLSYQFDPRLSPIVGAITLMMLVVRPVWSTIGYARKRNVVLWRSGAAALALCLAGFALFIPLPDRLLFQGSFDTMDTRLVEATEGGQLLREGNALYLDNPELRHQMVDTKLRTEMLTNSARAVSLSATEQAALAQDVKQLRDLSTHLESRLGALKFEFEDTAVWTPLDSDLYEGAWVVRAGTSLGAVSIPKSALLTLSIDQAVFEQGLDLSEKAVLQIRVVHDADCQFSANLIDKTPDFLAKDGRISLSADPIDMPLCAQNLRTGSAVVARLGTNSKSIVTRVRIAASRLLQDRLPVNLY